MTMYPQPVAIDAAASEVKRLDSLWGKIRIT